MNLNFRHRISIVEEKPNSGPEPGSTIETVATLWADIKTMKGSEYNSATIAGNLGISRFIIRYVPNIEAHMKVEFKGNQYDIESITNDDERNRTITIIGKAKI